MKQTNDAPVRSSSEIKFKDTPQRFVKIFNFARDLGFAPDEIIVEKVRGRNNTFRFHFPLTGEALKKYEADRKKREALAKSKEKADKRRADGGQVRTKG